MIEVDGAQVLEADEVAGLGDNVYIRRAHRGTVAMKIEALRSYKNQARLAVSLVNSIEKKSGRSFPQARVAALRFVAAVDKATPIFAAAVEKLKGREPKGVPPDYVGQSAWELARTIEIDKLNQKLTNAEIAARKAHDTFAAAEVSAGMADKPEPRRNVDWSKLDQVTVIGSAMEAAGRTFEHLVNKAAPELIRQVPKFVASRERLVLIVGLAVIAGVGWYFLRGVKR